MLITVGVASIRQQIVKRMLLMLLHLLLSPPVEPSAAPLGPGGARLCSSAFCSRGATALPPPLLPNMRSAGSLLQPLLARASAAAKKVRTQAKARTQARANLQDVHQKDSSFILPRLPETPPLDLSFLNKLVPILEKKTIKAAKKSGGKKASMQRASQPLKTALRLPERSDSSITRAEMSLLLQDIHRMISVMENQVKSNFKREIQHNGPSNIPQSYYHLNSVTPSLYTTAWTNPKSNILLHSEAEQLDSLVPDDPVSRKIEEIIAELDARIKRKSSPLNGGPFQ